MNGNVVPAPAVICAQCGRAPVDSAELARWRPHEIIAEGPPDDVVAAMLLCPDCVEDYRLAAYDAGEAD